MRSFLSVGSARASSEIELSLRSLRKKTDQDDCWLVRCVNAILPPVVMDW